MTSEELRSAIFRVEKPGYESLEKVFAEGQITSFALPRSKTISPAGTRLQPSAFPTTTVLTVGGVIAVGLIVFLASR
ncbi:MAG: hypothetical protein MN733_36045 [Nitrososphaera sp.]|nr:hypothetical protein [Nitrososphaera sp.]